LSQGGVHARSEVHLLWHGMCKKWSSRTRRSLGCVVIQTRGELGGGRPPWRAETCRGRGSRLRMSPSSQPKLRNEACARNRQRASLSAPCGAARLTRERRSGIAAQTRLQHASGSFRGKTAAPKPAVLRVAECGSTTSRKREAEPHLVRRPRHWQQSGCLCLTGSQGQPVSRLGT